MQLFGRGRRAQRPPADVDLAERLEGITVQPASPKPSIPDVDEPEARSDAPPGDPSTKGAERAIPASSASPSEPEAGPLEAGPQPQADPVVAATPGTGDPAPQAVNPVEPPEAPTEASAAQAEVELPPPEPYVDPLTDLLGPAIFERLLAAESARERRYRRPATLVLAELAGLDDLVRAWGVDVGLQAVTSLAAVLRATSRTSDYVARIAADRFAIILTETDEIAAINYVDRVREAWGAEQAIAVGALRVGMGWAGTPGHATLADARPAAEQILRDDLV